MEEIFRRDKTGNIILGFALPAFVYNMTYHQTLIKVYEDGMIDCWELVNFEDFKLKVKKGWVVTRVPKGKEISCHHLYYGINSLEFYVEEDEFIKEVEDVILKLQKKSTSSEICFKCFVSYLQSPSNNNRNELAKAYERVPKHLRIYVLHSMEFKDDPIKDIINSLNVDKKDFDNWKEYFLT